MNPIPLDRVVLAPIWLAWLLWSAGQYGVTLADHSELAVPTEQRLATVGKTRVLCQQPGRYIGWPSIAVVGNGDLLVVFSGDRAGHVSGDGKTQMIRTADRGQTWSEPVVIHDFPIDDRDAGIVRTAKGTLVVSWFTGPPYHTDLQGHYVIRSSDHGLTWSKPIRTEVSAPHGPVQMSDGRLIFLGQRPHCSHTVPQNFNGPPADSPLTVSLQESRDDGRSWQLLSHFAVPPQAKMLSFDEPHLVETNGGRWIAQFRDCNPPHRLWQSESDDAGLTWTEPWRTEIHGYPPHLLRLQNGWLLSTYAKRWEPFGEYACVSRDAGESWETEEEIFLSAGPNGDLGYPATVQLADRSLWTVFYQAARDGELPCLMGVHWRLKESPRPADR